MFTVDFPPLRCVPCASKCVTAQATSDYNGDSFLLLQLGHLSSRDNYKPSIKGKIGRFQCSEPKPSCKKRSAAARLRVSLGVLHVYCPGVAVSSGLRFNNGKEWY